MPEDRDALAGWVRDRDEAAFACLVSRHASLVAGTCRRLLGDSQAAEEATQAVFILLAQQAARIRDPGRLSFWLYGTARRVCARHHRANARRRRHEHEAAMRQQQDHRTDHTDPVWIEARGRLDQALADLSTALREAVIGCYLEGRPNADVALRLGVSEEVVRQRLHYARGKMREWFVRRGIAIPMAVLAVGLTSEGASAAEPELIHACVHTALHTASALPAHALASKVSLVLGIQKSLVVGALIVTLGCGGFLVQRAMAGGRMPAPISADVHDLRGAWPGWRGPDRDGVAPKSPKLLDAWPPEGPRLVWRNSDDIPDGFSSPVVGEGRVFLYIHWSHATAKAPISTAFLADLGWAPDMSGELAKRLEDAWLSPDRPDAGECPSLNDLFKQRFAQLDDVLAKHPRLDAYITAFIASLDADDAKRFAGLIRKRLCTRAMVRSGGLPRAWLEKLSTLRDREFRLNGVYEQALREAMSGYSGQEGPDLINADGSLEVWAAWHDHWLTDTLLCLDASTGRRLWRTDFADHLPVYHYLCSSTPTVWNGKVYFIGHTGLYCLSVTDGSAVWQDLGVRECHASVLVKDGLLYDPSTACARDPESGRELWRSPMGEGRSEYTSPVLWMDEGKARILCGDALLDAADGKLLWKWDKLQSESTPVVQGDHLLAIYDYEAFKSMRISSQKAEMVWKREWGVFNEWRASPLLYQDHIYCSDSIDHSFLCADLATGQVRWREKNASADVSSPIIVDGKVITAAVPGGLCSDGGGHLLMFEATPERFIPLGKFHAHISGCTSPAVAGGKLYIRTANTQSDDSGVACYDLTVP